MKNFWEPAVKGKGAKTAFGGLSRRTPSDAVGRRWRPSQMIEK
jgi:hypothetical protein